MSFNKKYGCFIGKAAKCLPLKIKAFEKAYPWRAVWKKITVRHTYRSALLKLGLKSHYQ